MNRRLLLRGAAGAAAAVLMPRASLAADYDLVIRGGRVIDPVRRFDGLADVAIRGDKIAAVRPGIPAAAGAQSIDARGRIVAPWLIDVHLHARDPELPPSAILSRGIAADRDSEVLKLALQVARPAAIPIMIHIGDTATPLKELLAVLRPGDVVTHMYAPVNGILDAKGRVLPEARAARQRGVLFDFGHGLNEPWSREVAQRGLDQGFAPDTISSDLNLPGRTQHVTVLELTEGGFEFVDNYKGSRTGRQRLVTRAVVYGGRHVA